MVSIYEVLGTKEFSTPKLLVPERELLVATLDRAVLDYYGTDEETCGEATDWLFGDSDPSEPFSFLWICDHLGIEPTRLRNRVRSLAIPRNVSQAHRWLRTKVQSKDGLLERNASYDRRYAA